MKLRQIKLSGFKSFVEPVSISVTSRLSGIVGPNGSGKSNVIDAVRWVAGESSAKNLRGNVLDDVIFNGSANRKPAGRASVELIFDNSAGRAPGAWSKYAEISVRRAMTRDGLSEYFINGTRVIRRDVTQMFLGTGFGARSYSIIEQGMISRIIEAKPEELGAYVEEASGISQFRQKRQETLSKLRSTQENLNRLDDVRIELQQHLRKLKLQSTQAKRYRKLREKDRELRIQLLLREYLDHRKQTEEKEIELRKLEVLKEQRIAAVRAVEAELEKARKNQLELRDSLSKVEIKRNQTDADIKSVERRIAEHEEAKIQDERRIKAIDEDVANLRRSESEQKASYAEASNQLASQDGELASAADELEKRRMSFSDSESELAAAAQHVADLNRSLADAERKSDSIELRRSAASREIERNAATEQELRMRLDGQDDIKDSDEAKELNRRIDETSETAGGLEKRLQRCETDLAASREKRERLLDALEELRQGAQEENVRLLELRRRYETTSAEHDQAVEDWMAANQLRSSKRVSSSVEVDGGWERALDRVLGRKLSAMRVSGTEGLLSDSQQTLSQEMYFVDSTPVPESRDSALTPLANFVKYPDSVMHDWLHGVYVADTLAEVQDLRRNLRPGECIVSRNGAMAGINWFSPALDEAEPAGVLELSKRIEKASALVADNDSLQLEKREEIDRLRDAISQLEEQAAELRAELSGNNSELESLRAKLNEERVRKAASIRELDDAARRLEQVRSDAQQLHAAVERHEKELVENDEIRRRVQEEHSRKSEECGRLQEAVIQRRGELDRLVERRHQVELGAERSRSEKVSAEKAIGDLMRRAEELKVARGEIEERLSADDPVPALKQELDSLLKSSHELGHRLADSGSMFDQAETQYKSIDEKRLREQLSVEDANSAIGDMNMELNGLAMQCDAAQDSLSAFEIDVSDEESFSVLDDEFDSELALEKLEKLERRIQNIGPINLTAIDEFETELERKEYLDSQHEDLTEAIATLESSIEKIDRETRQRYVETFDSVNGYFQEFFPKLFGGGKAYLELFGDYPENAGISVYARPKGKRINHVQSLSGGEKALTAVALLLSFFQLNPSPVCFLDEIDAPLDDENVHRLCENLRELSDRTQLLMVTHNKITMETVDTLIGVAMPEPNVSQLLSVSLEQAQEYAA